MHARTDEPYGKRNGVSEDAQYIGSTSTVYILRHGLKLEQALILSVTGRLMALVFIKPRTTHINERVLQHFHGPNHVL